MVERLLEDIESSLTQYHAIRRVEDKLIEKGFVYLSERDIWKISKGGKYYTVRNDSSMIAFSMGERFAFNIVAAHTDSPCLKLKGNADMSSAGVNKLNVEVYGGPILNTFFDRKLTICGRAYYDEEGTIKGRLITSPFNVVIPNVAIHFNREANSGVKINPQIDLCPITSMGKDDIKNLVGNALSYDLYASCAEKGYTFGVNNEFISSPRLDDLEGVFGSLEAFMDSEGESINVLALFDCEEVGSMTRQGAASTFLRDTLERISDSMGKSDCEIKEAFAGSIILSLDNAHAKHPNHPEYSDPTNETLLGGGIAIKHHANYNYTTDAFSEAYLKKFFRENEIKFQDYYQRSDLRCGGTLGAISSSKLSIISVDIGLPQLAMHSAVECAAVSDYEELVKGLRAFYNSFKI